MVNKIKLARKLQKYKTTLITKYRDSFITQSKSLRHTKKPLTIEDFFEDLYVNISRVEKLFGCTLLYDWV